MLEAAAVCCVVEGGVSLASAAEDEAGLSWFWFEDPAAAWPRGKSIEFRPG